MSSGVLRRFRDISLTRKLYFAIGIMAFLILLELFLLWFTMHSLSAVRAYVAGEGLWSKAQKSASHHLQNYLSTGDEREYLAFQRNLLVPLGDKKARLELEKPSPDHLVAYRGFYEGRNHPQDIDGMIKLFQRFRNIYYIDKAIGYWAEGDSLISEIIRTGYELRVWRRAGLLDQQSSLVFAERINTINAHLTRVEDNFSYTLGEGSRWLEKLILKILILTALIVELTGLFLSVSISRNISKSIHEIVDVAKSVSRGDFSKRAAIHSRDEMGFLAGSLNHMIEELQKNIQEKEHVQEELSKTAHTLQSLVNTAPVAIIVVDLDLKVKVWNPGAENIFGWKAAEIIGQKLPIVPPGKTEESRTLQQELIKNRETSNIDTVRVRKDGTMVHVNLSLGPLLDNKDQPAGMIGVITDISEKKATEKQLAEYLNELEDTNEELNRFAYIVSHDLKAPLRAIGSLVSWIKEDNTGKLEPEGQQHLELLSGRVSRMHLLIEGILEYSRIGRSKEINEDINLDELISEVTDLISPPANIRIKAGRKLPVIRYDKTRAVQVFQNLIGNAVKFNDKANGEVTIDYSEEGNFWKFWIKDNGKGIDNKYFGKIFEIFQTLQPRDQFESTGIGLTIVRKIIETAGGRIWLESDPGKGSCFYFTIPRFIPV